MKRLILLVVFFSSLAYAGSEVVEGKGEGVKAAKWNALKKAMLSCSGAVRATSDWEISVIKPAPGCPGPFEDESPCDDITKASASFECL